jgi:hypothetical protein
MWMPKTCHKAGTTLRYWVVSTFIGNVHLRGSAVVTERLRAHGKVCACHGLREGNLPSAMARLSRFT